ncbi:MAG: hypothetical protein PSX81_08975 [bacterium]|nr:hypothetical protein [bacterium]
MILKDKIQINIIIFLIIIIYSCKPHRMQFYEDLYSRGVRPGIILIKDSNIFFRYDNGYYLTGKYLYNGNDYKISLDKIPFNDESIIDISCKYNCKYKHKDSVRLELINNTSNLSILINNKEIHVPTKNTKVYLDFNKSDLAVSLKLKLKFIVGSFDLFHGYSDSTIINISMNCLQNTNFNHVSLDCNKLYIYNYFKENFDGLEMDRISFSNNEDSVYLYNIKNMFKKYVRSKPLESQLKRNKRHKSVFLPEVYFLR